MRISRSDKVLAEENRGIPPHIFFLKKPGTLIWKLASLL
jgi:hypothetical protein